MDKLKARLKRKKSIRKKIFGVQEKPRMCIHKTNNYISVQLVDDIEGKTICSLSTSAAALREKIGSGSKKSVKAATILGEEIAKAAKPKGVSTVVFDRSGYRYHGAVKSLADAARKNGLKF